MGGLWFRWRQESGEEISVLIDSDNNFRGGAPHFAGSTQVEVALVGAFDDPEGFWEGAFYAWMNPSDDDLQSGDYPFVFDVADYWTIRDRVSLPQRAQVQIAAFAHEIEFFASEEDFDASQTDEVKYASNFFIPAGLFIDEDADEGASPQPYAVFAG